MDAETVVLTPEGVIRQRNRMYVTIGVAMLVLTLIAVFLVETRIVGSLLMPILIAMAIAQVLMQAFLFMHLRGSRTVYTYFFMGGMSLAILIGFSLMVLIQQWA